MRRKINRFHGTETVENIKTGYDGIGDADDVLISLACAAETSEDKYAVYKLRKIERALCCHKQDGCTCGGFNREVKI